MRSAHGTTRAATVALTLAALVAFAANSILCRLALGEGFIDAASFTTIRVISGALVLAAILLRPGRATRAGRPEADWRSVAALFAYMFCFSFAYLSLSAGTGALILFGAVQLTMFAVALRRGEYFSAVSWSGFGLAVAGLVYLLLPGLKAPDPLGAALMIAAGIAWGFYSLLGQRAGDPVTATAGNFIYAVPPALLASLAFLPLYDVTWAGVALAAASGAIASGAGYVVWYAALRGLTASRAATVQLSVPVIAALGGIVLLDEAVTFRLAVASAATLGGVAIVLMQRMRRAPG